MTARIAIAAVFALAVIGLALIIIGAVLEDAEATS